MLIKVNVRNQTPSTSLTLTSNFVAILTCCEIKNVVLNDISKEGTLNCLGIKYWPIGFVKSVLMGRRVAVGSASDS